MRPAGRPPPNTKSNPAMPVGTFESPFPLLRAPVATLPRAHRLDVATAVPPLSRVKLQKIGAALGNAAKPSTAIPSQAKKSGSVQTGVLIVPLNKVLFSRSGVLQ
jgi:hypothetical protein